MTHTVAETFRNDPRVAAAKQQLLDVLGEHQAKLSGVRPEQAPLRSTYERTLEQFGQHRGGALFLPYLGSGLGRGPLVELDDGSVKYDFIGGIGVPAPARRAHPTRAGTHALRRPPDRRAL